MGGESDDLVRFRRNEQRLEIALAAGRLGSWELDLRTRILKSTAQCKANHGYAADADMQLYPHIVDAVDAEHRERFVGVIDTAIATGGSFEIEVPHYWPDGTHHWLFVAGRVVDDSCIVGVSQDVTAAHTVQQALRAREEQ